MLKPEELKSRFMDKVSPEPNSGCWLWTGTMSSTGYGRLKVDGVMLPAHRISYSLFIGSIGEGKFICHTCDNRLCVNPDHLFCGTHDENMKDMVSKGRQSKENKYGASNGRAKLTDADVIAIRRSELTQAALAEQYSVSRSQISMIKTRVRWSHLDE